VALGLGLLLGLAACEESKQDILEKAEGVATKSALKSALGRPDTMDKLGPLERWTYKASDGTVIFIITGDTVAIEATGGN